MAEVNRTYVHFPGSSRVPAGRKNMLSVFCDIYWIGTKLYLSFAFFLFLFCFQYGLHCSVWVCMRGSGHARHPRVHVVYSYTVFPPCGHASGTGTYYICQCLNSVTSIFCQQVLLVCLEGQTLLSSLYSIAVCLCHSFPPHITLHLSAFNAVFCQPPSLPPHVSSSPPYFG